MAQHASEQGGAVGDVSCEDVLVSSMRAISCGTYAAEDGVAQCCYEVGIAPAANVQLGQGSLKLQGHLVGKIKELQRCLAENHGWPVPATSKVETDPRIPGC